MHRVRAGLILALVLSVVPPPVVWSGTAETSPPAGAVSLAAPSGAACALLRGAAKAEKTFTTDWAASPDRLPQHPASVTPVARVDAAASLSHLDLDNPPLAPRPPPLG
jgi:hypothetical protein